MKRLFDPAPIKTQIANLLADRENIDRAINALESALRSADGVGPTQGEFSINLKSADTTLHDAVRRACFVLKDGITRQRVIAQVEREHPLIKPKSPSVAASLINLTKGEHPILVVAIEGKGRSPSFYSTQGETTHRLSGDEIKDLLDPANTRGTGGWQSLFASLQKSFDKTNGTIRLSPEQRANIYKYIHNYGTGGWQDRTKRIFRRELPHLFVA
jgi:hypothetical protein